MIKYTAYNTNGISYYDSFANFDLVTALVRSFHDSDLQQYVAFTTAVEQLIGDVDWVLDPANNQIKYWEKNELNCQYLLKNTEVYSKFGDSSLVCSPSAASAQGQRFFDLIGGGRTVCNLVVNSPVSVSVMYKYSSDASCTRSLPFSGVKNPAYSPEDEYEEKTIPLEVVASKVISNAESGDDEVLKLLSQDYINLVANSVFDSNPSKQFVKLEDLIPQLEANKVLR